MPGFLTWIVAVLLMLLESTLLAAFGVENLCLQTALGVTFYLALERDFVPGAATLAALLLPIEWLVAGVPGYYALGLVTVFLLLRLVRGSIQGGWSVARFLLAVVAAMLHAITMVVALLVSDPSSPVVGAVLWQILPASLTAAVGCLLVGRLFARLDAAMAPRQRGLLDGI